MMLKVSYIRYRPNWIQRFLVGLLSKFRQEVYLGETVENPSTAAGLASISTTSGPSVQAGSRLPLNEC